MAHIIIVTGSARPTSIAPKVLPLVEDALQRTVAAEITVVNAAELDLPFYDAPVPPSHEQFVVSDEHVKAWTAQVAAADGVIMLTPEYNGNMTAVQQNAIDWVYKEWADKPVALIGYGWYDPSRAQAAAKVSFGVVKAALVEPFAQLQFAKDISVAGDVLDAASIEEKLTATVEAFAAALSVRQAAVTV